SRRTVQRTSGEKPQIAFVVTGQGSQYLRMGLGLVDTCPDFRAKLEECDELVRPLLGRGLVDLIGQDSERLDRTDIAQPVLFSIAVSLAAQWQAWGVEPSVVLGHSLGDYVAAHLAGVTALKESLELVVARARLMQDTDVGAMATIFAAEEQVREHLAHGSGPTVRIAAVNHAHQVVISGSSKEVTDALEGLKNYRHQRLPTTRAFHGPLMASAAEELLAWASKVEYRPPHRAWISSMDGQFHAAGTSPPSIDYWRQQLLSEVRWDWSLQTLTAQPVDAVIELGPHPVLCTLAKASKSSRSKEISWLPSLRKNVNDVQRMLTTAAALYERGAEIRWVKVNRPTSIGKAKVPTYAFDRQRYWLDTEDSTNLNDATPPSQSDSLLRRIEWQKQPEASNEVFDGESAFAGLWIVAGPASAGRRLEQVYGDRGVTFVVADAATESTTFEALVRKWHQDPSFRGVLFYWGMGVRGADEAQQACWKLIETVRRLKSAVPAGSALWVVTQGCQSVKKWLAPNAEYASFDETCYPSSLWGLARVVHQEHPQIDIKLIDLESETDDVLPPHAIASSESQLAIRAGQVYVPRLLPYAPERSIDRSPVRARGCYVLTGGLGALGLRVARWLAQRGARRIILVTRPLTKAPKINEAQRQSAVAEIERLGAEVNIVHLDLADAEAVQGLKQALPSTIHGIIHAAGWLDRINVDSLKQTQLAAAWGPKVRPLKILFDVVGPQTDFVMLFSSAASVWGGKGLGHYAAANAVLDEVSHRMNGHSCRVVSVSWGPWNAGGLDAGDDKAWLNRMGGRCFTRRGCAIGRKRRTPCE
ncbi:MAG: type I polyketide synthase, partial [Myxococcota bacterium]